jgi:tetratricopeptide (TPR) repeat protein
MTIYQDFKIPEPKAFDNNISVVIAEDFNEIRLILNHHLNKKGFKDIRLVNDGKKLLTTLSERPADIILVSQDLPIVSGIDCLKELTEDIKLQRSAFILMSKPLTKQEIMYAVEVGINELILKPLTLDEVMNKIKSAYANYIHPKNPEKAYEFAKLQVKGEHLDIAFKLYEELGRLAPEAARPWMGQANIHFIHKNLDLAEECLKQAISKNPNYIHAYILYAELKLAQNDKKEALKFLKKAIEISPLNLVRYEKVCSLLLEQKNYDECIEVLEFAGKAGLSHPFITERLGFCHLKKLNYKAAEKYLRMAMAQEPTNMFFMNSLAICHWDCRNYAEALNLFNQIIKQEPDNISILFNRSIILVAMNRKEEAKKSLERILRLDPGERRAIKKLAELNSQNLAAA